MKATEVGVKEFQKRLFLYLDLLPLVLTKRGKPFAKLVEIKKKK